MSKIFSHWNKDVKVVLTAFSSKTGAISAVLGFARLGTMKLGNMSVETAENSEDESSSL